MGNWQWLLDTVVAALLAATLLRARRLDRALSALRQDRGALETLLGGFDSSAQQARDAVATLRELVEGAGRRIEQQTATALALQDDLALLVGRGERLDERLDHALRAARQGFAQPASTPVAVQQAPRQAVRPAVEPPMIVPTPPDDAAIERVRATPSAAAAETRRVRSKAERDLLVALGGR